MITYTNSLDNITPNKLKGFFVDWPNPPSSETHVRLLEGSFKFWLAVDDETGTVVGFINAISDGILAAYIPLLEVLPDYKGQGIGTELTKRMLESLNYLYMIDLLCDEDVQPFYERTNMRRTTGMFVRNYQNQAGVTPE